MNLVPLFDRILVRRDDAATKHGSIIIPDGAKEKPNTGIVIAVGEGRLCQDSLIPQIQTNNWSCHVEPLRVKVGQRVYFQSYAGTELEDTSTSPPTVLLLMDEDDVLAIVKDPNDSAGPASDSRIDTLDLTQDQKDAKDHWKKQAEIDDGN